MSDIHMPTARQAYTHTLRVTFAYDAKDVKVARVLRVAMRAPAPALPAPSGKTVGFWLEVEDAAGKALYHFPIHDPMRQDQEVFNDPEGGKPVRAPSRQTSGEFEILVPDLPSGGRFVLHGTPRGVRAPARMSHAASTPLVTHSLDELRRLAAETARKPRGGRP